MQAGTLRHRVQIQKYTETRNTKTGQLTETWIPSGSVWAAVEPLNGNERFEAMQVKAQVTTRIRMRYLPELSPKDRIKHGSRVFLIEHIINMNERNRELHAMCREQV